MVVAFVRMPVVMSVTMMSMPKRSQSNNVDEESKDTDNEELVQSVELVAFPEPLKSVEDNFYTDQPGTELNWIPQILSGNLHEKNAIGEAGQCIDLPIAIRKFDIGMPFAHDSCS